MFIVCLLIQVSDYARDLEEMQMISKEDYLVSLRRYTCAFLKSAMLLYSYKALHMFHALQKEQHFLKRFIKISRASKVCASDGEFKPYYWKILLC
jgi:hypothetical protein